MCMERGCHVTFEDAVFHSCSLVVPAGAQETLTSPKLRDMGRPSHLP